MSFWHSWSKLLCLFLLAGCGTDFSIRNIDKPAPLPYESWVKSGASELDVKKALLECGDPAPNTTGFIYEKALGMKDLDAQLNHQFLTGACMEKSGFRLRWGDTIAKYCSWDRHRHLPACQPGAVIPERSVERRLNSWYCKVKTDREYCRKHAFNPAACDDPKKDYNNPPPECRP
jgi:hypothetical protein